MICLSVAPCVSLIPLKDGTAGVKRFSIFALSVMVTAAVLCAPAKTNATPAIDRTLVGDQEELKRVLATLQRRPRLKYRRPTPEDAAKFFRKALVNAASG